MKSSHVDIISKRVVSWAKWYFVVEIIVVAAARSLERRWYAFAFWRDALVILLLRRAERRALANGGANVNLKVSVVKCLICVAAHRGSGRVAYKARKYNESDGRRQINIQL